MVGDRQNLTRHGPEQPAVVDPSLNRRIGLDDLQRSIPTELILWLHAYVYHPSFNCLTDIMIHRPSLNRVFV